MAALAQAPILAVLIVLLFGNEAAAAINQTSWPSVVQGVASTALALALASIWLGCSIAVGGISGRGLPPAPAGEGAAGFLTALSGRLAVLASICGAGCALLLGIVRLGSGLASPWLAAWSLLFLASLVGLLFGYMVAAFAPTWRAAAVILLLCFVPLTALAGRLSRLREMNLPLRAAAAAMPSRWAFEGLLLLESPHHPAPPSPVESNPVQPTDLVEEFFPAASEQMGTTADTMALGSMVLGATAGAALLCSQAATGRSSRN
jgi:hypothetical protein